MPPSGSFFARDSSGIATEVSTPPISSSKMMFGSVLARLYESETIHAPKNASTTTLATNPVNRLASVATAIVPDARTTPEVRSVRIAAPGGCGESVGVALICPPSRRCPGR